MPAGVRASVVRGEYDYAAGNEGDAAGTGNKTGDLSGDWAFWPSEFVDPGADPRLAPHFGSFPASWSSYGFGSFPAKGFASYAVTISGLDPAVRYGFRFPGYSCAVRYFADGAEIHSTGRVGIAEADEVAAWDTAVVAAYAKPEGNSGSIRLVMHISNHHDIYPASPVPIRFGTYRALAAERLLSRVLMIIPFGAMLAMGAYFLALFVFHRSERSCLWLGLLCAVFALRVVCYDEFLIQDFFPAFPSWLMFRFGYLTFSLALAGFTGFVRAQFPLVSNGTVARVVSGAGVAYALMNLFAPVGAFTAVLVPFQAFALLSGLYVLSVVARAAFAGQEGARMFIAGFSLFFGAVVRDILIANRVVEGMFLAHYGVLAIVATMALIESAAGALSRTNESLSRFVPGEFLRYLGKNSITDVCLGDNTMRQMCVMFLHLGVDTALDESRSRLGMLELFNELLLRVNPVIQARGGFVDKYLAEGMMVLLPDDGGNAISCALEIVACVSDRNAERAASGLPPVTAAAGIHRGSLMLGTIGESERMDSTVISDVVNTASRLNGYALSKGMAIAVSAEVADQPSARDGIAAEFVPHGETRLRGRDAPVTIYEVRP